RSSKDLSLLTLFDFDSKLGCWPLILPGRAPPVRRRPRPAPRSSPGRASAGRAFFPRLGLGGGSTMHDITSLDCSRIAQDLQIRKVQVEAVVGLLDEG